MKKTVLSGVVAGVLVVMGAPAAAVDGMAVEGGTGNGTDMGRVTLQWNWSQRWFQGAGWHVGGFWDLGLGHWRRDALPGQNEYITDIGLTPVFRLQRDSLEGLYVEAGIGAHLLSQTAIGNKRLSTRFQFGDHIGFGYRFGARAAWDLAYRYQHLSNGSIKKPNDGIDSHQVRLQYHFN